MKKTNLEITGVTAFRNPQFGEIRTVMRDGEPWFVAVDVCRAFGVVNSRNVTARLDDDEKGVHVVDTPGGNQGMTIVNEPGLYHMLFTMEPANAHSAADTKICRRLEQLRLFKRWVTHEILPTLRKHGVYAMDQLLDNPDMLISALQKLKSERERANRAEQLNAVQGRLIEEMQPKATYYDLVLSSTSAVPITMIAKDYGLSAVRLNHILHDLGVQYRMDGTWVLYQCYADKGYTKTVTHPISEEKSVMHTYWTQKGRLFLYDLLKSERGLLPLIERSDSETDPAKYFIPADGPGGIKADASVTV